MCCTCATCVCVSSTNTSDKAVIRLLNSTKAGPASVASPPPRGETNNNKKKEREGERKRERGQFPAQREKKTFALLLCFTRFLFC